LGRPRISGGAGGLAVGCGFISKSRYRTGRRGQPGRLNIARKSDSCYAALYHRIAARRGKKRAHFAVAHSLLVARRSGPDCEP
jgi:hypothetical protein